MAHITQSPDESIDLKVDASQLRLAAVWGPVAFPPNMPAYARQDILAKAGQDRNAAGAFTIDALMHPNDARRRDGSADDNDNLMVLAEAAELRREREEWARTESTVCGVTKTGAEWAEFAERLRGDPALHRRIIDAYEARGMSEAEAERHYDRVAELARIEAIPPNQRTEAQTEAHERGKSDPVLGQDMQEANRMDSIYAPTQQQRAAVDSSAAPASPQIAAVDGPGF